MSLFRWGRRGEERGAVVFTNPPIPSNREEMYGGPDLTRAEASLQKIAMWSSVDLIASLASELPVDVFRGRGRDRRQIDVPKHLTDPAGDGYGLEDWIYQYLMAALLRGNTVGTILNVDRSGRFPTQVMLYHPDEVNGWRDSNGHKQWRINGREVDAAKIWHRRVHPVSGQLLGLSPVAFHATTIGLGLTAQRFAMQFFLDGAHPTALLTNDEIEMKQSIARTAKLRFLAAVRGNREPVVFGKGWKYQAIQIKPEESQFLETNKYTSAECARIYGPGMAEILGYETGNSLTYQTLEGRLQHLLVLSVNRWFRRVERALSGMLPDGEYARINRGGMLQATTLERYKVHEIALRNDIKVVNEVRDDEELQPVEWGDKPRPAKTVAGQPPGDGHVHDNDGAGGST